MKNIYLTGDCHGNFYKIGDFVETNKLTEEDIILILGDAGLNYYLNKTDIKWKKYLSKFGVKILCIHGNHEARPETISTYKYEYLEEFQCFGWYEEKYPNIIFLDDGLAVINEMKFLVMGGAYSVDKFHRLSRGTKWFEDEQMSEKNKEKVLSLVEEEKEFDYVLSHTAPYSQEPVYLFLSFLDQKKIDKSMEHFLDRIYNKIKFKKWFFGHYHDDKVLDNNMVILYNTFLKLPL